jgi:prepilin-type N-terminal cleavage/methylation domain-containing protein
MNNIFKKERGFTLLEMLISILIISIGVSGVYMAVAKYARDTQTERESFMAAYLCQEGIEIVRNLRDFNLVSGAVWKNGLTSCGTGCEADYHTPTTLSAWTTGSILYINQTTGLYEYTSSTVPTSYKRKIVIDNTTNTNILSITVYVYWENNTMTAKEDLYNWR